MTTQSATRSRKQASLEQRFLVLRRILLLVGPSPSWPVRLLAFPVSLERSHVRRLAPSKSKGMEPKLFSAARSAWRSLSSSGGTPW